MLLRLASHDALPQLLRDLHANGTHLGKVISEAVRLPEPALLHVIRKGRQTRHGFLRLCYLDRRLAMAFLAFDGRSTRTNQARGYK